MKTDSREILDSFSLKNFVVEHQLQLINWSKTGLEVLGLSAG